MPEHKNQSQSFPGGQQERQEGTQTRPSHMNQGNQTFRPDKQKQQEAGKQQDKQPRKAS